MGKGRPFSPIIKKRGKMGKLAIFKELWDFTKARKKWWLGPIVVRLNFLGY